MEMIAGVAIPFFAVLLCGYLARHLKILDESGVRGLNAFVFWFALPALLFWKVSESPFERLSDPSFYLVYEGGTLFLYAAVFLAMRWGLRRTRAESAIVAIGASWGNVGYMGVPLLLAAYGTDQALPAVIATALDSIVMQTLTVILIESGGGDRRTGILGVARGLASNPLILAVLAGFVVAALDLELPATLVGFLSILGPAAGPGALFALGATLTGGLGLRRDYGMAAGMIGAKLLVLPLLVFVILQFIPLPPRLVEPTLITAALPTAASVFVLAQRYNVLERPVALVVFASHLLGIATLTGLLVILQF
ncbi:AEC family transporter [Geminicoccus roseus]|uniref:AEC family transporter n=1 Tax=Geminicoccus roseus TaxID=404900 RepID=UPI0004205A62|nr:AEC family transporter [Geminicoccus roseus]